MSDDNGVWVLDADMHPSTNIAGRRWRTRDGRHSGVYMGQGSLPTHISQSKLLWFFPDEQKVDKP